MTNLAITLSAGERSALAEAEATIERGIKTFIETGAALMMVRDNRLYRETHGTFQDYCADRWGLSGSHAYRLIDGARVAELISSPVGEEINISERAARELSPLLEDPDELREVWNEAAGRTERTPSATDIRRVRSEREQPAPNETATEAIRERPSVNAREEDPTTSGSAKLAAAAPSAVTMPAGGAVVPEFDPRAAVRAAIDRHAPDPQAGHREWRRDFLDDVHAVHAVIRRGVPAVMEHADTECIEEMYRCAELLAAFADEVAAAISQSRPNVIQLRRTS